jgi:hypothetical protein
MQRGLEVVASAFHLQENFNKVVEKALTILNAEFFLIAFDDIDVNMQKGWMVLEVIRKYLTTPKLVCLLSGNMKLYSYNVRLQQWNQLKPLRDLESDSGSLLAQVNELEGQYLLKIFKTENRIHLGTIYDMLQKGGINIMVDGQEIDDVYKNIIRKIGIEGKEEQQLIANFLLRQPIRTQINFIGTKSCKDSENEGLRRIEAFITQLYANDIPVEEIENNPRMITGAIATFLEKKNVFKDAYLLLPNTADESINASVIGLNILFSQMQGKAPYLYFEYMLKVGYLRNLILMMPEKGDKEGLISYGSYNADASLKNCVGLTMAYMSSKGANMTEHISIYGTKKNAKKALKDRIDSVLTGPDVTQAQQILGYIPLCALSNTHNNSKEYFYSIYVLLAAIGQLLKCNSETNDIKRALNDVQLLRSYQKPSFNEQSMKLDDSANDYDDNDWNDDDSVNTLVDQIKSWRESIPEGITIPPYMLARIMTRLYTTNRARKTDLGNLMHRSVINFLNASLIEESRNSAMDGEDNNRFDVSKVNINNTVNSDKIFIDNFKYIHRLDSELKMIPFTKWLIQCPLLRCFIDESLEVCQLNEDSNPLTPFNIKTILKNVNVKDGVDVESQEEDGVTSQNAAPIKFSGASNKIQSIIDAIIAKYPDFDFQTKIIDCTTDEAIKNIEELHLFSKFGRKAMSTFRENFPSEQSEESLNKPQ